ncbi:MULTISPECIES: Scr1 family TA system antitoxin-like transcriptional regulator [unclassified Micromonospora]|uniref:Scr1 family TA system antitoxin-like transcriptional regulator n=1 Tax=unclassified Micromonospora TaxID=2617518 RepID=UPI003A897C84
MADTHGVAPWPQRFEAGAHLADSSGFALLSFERDDPPLGYIETLAGELFLESTRDLARVSAAYDNLRMLAMSPAESVKLIKGYYQATKHALEAIGDSLRHEVARFDIKVVLIEPSPILGGCVPDSVADLGMQSHGDPALYKDFWDYFVQWHQAYRLSDNPPLRGKVAVRAEHVAKVIETAVTHPNPRVRYRLGIPARLLTRMRATIDDRNWDRFVRAFFPIP